MEIDDDSSITHTMTERIMKCTNKTHTWASGVAWTVQHLWYARVVMDVSCEIINPVFLKSIPYLLFSSLILVGTKYPEEIQPYYWLRERVH